MKDNKIYWKGLEQLANTEEFQQYANKEFPDHLPLSGDDNEPSRRDFLKLMGFGIAAVSLAACETPIKKAIPYVNKPTSVDPSIPNYYASTYVSGSDYASVVVKTREGRPIKIEGNALSSVSGGGTTAQMEASVLSLYDKERLQSPLIGGEPTTWDDLDAAVTGDLNAATGKIFLVSNTIASPSTIKAIQTFQSKYPTIEWVQYDAVSSAALLDATEAAFGERVIPASDFSKAKTIVSFGDDFLGNSPNSTLANKQFAASRKLSDKKKDMSRLYVFESTLSLTGANADYRQPLLVSEQAAYLAALYNTLASKSGAETITVKSQVNNDLLDKAAKDLLGSRGRSVVTCGINDPALQSLVIAINNLLGNYGKTISISGGWLVRKGNDQALSGMASALKAGSASGVIFYNCNPVYDCAMGEEIKASLAGLKFSLSTSDRLDETSENVKYHAPDNHFLESWNDAELVKGKYSLSQPTISNIFNTRQAQDSFLTWAGSEGSFYDLIRTNWESEAYKTATGSFYNFDAFWDKCLHDGVYELSGSTDEPGIKSNVLSGLAEKLNGAAASGNGLELVLYTKSAIGTGNQANNPWLQEMPDPVSKACWDNYLTVSPKQAEEWGLKLGDMTTQTAALTVNGKVITVPVLPQPGQKYGTVGLALGYGRTKAGKVANGVGVNAYPFISEKDGYQQFSSLGVSVSINNDTYKIAQTQTTHTYMGRETVIQESILSKYKEDAQAGRYFPKIATSEGFKKPYAISLWKGHEYANHHWGMVVDLNSCTGCGSCTIACQVENNVPVVGKQEVLNRREMHWIRIDRYYSFSEEEVGNASGVVDKLRRMEQASENPEVVFQPMMCQHCNNAPCETVCPVAATTHSSEGLNQMTYNRCIGTRYCANNCPYKVRRFNWFKYHDNDQFPENMAMNNDLGKMVLNPDVTVRARGVIEKCSFCVQRIQAGKLEAKKEGRRPIDGEVTSACAASCPSEALVFGDMKDPNSRIAKLLKIESSEKGVEAKEDRAYHVLEEIRVMPNVWYLTKIRNKDEEVKAEA